MFYLKNRDLHLQLELLFGVCARVCTIPFLSFWFFAQIKVFINKSMNFTIK